MSHKLHDFHELPNHVTEYIGAVYRTRGEAARLLHCTTVSATDTPHIHYDRSEGALHNTVACVECMQNPDLSRNGRTKLTGCRMGKLRCIDGGGARTIEVQTTDLGWAQNWEALS